VNNLFDMRIRLETRLEAFLCRTLPLSYLLFCSFVFSIIFCLFEFNWDYLSGTSPYWRTPRGLIPGSYADISTAWSGYENFVHDAWRLPLFNVSKLGAPGGINIIFTDSIPILAMSGRLIYLAAGITFNPFGWWTAGCFVASAMSLTLLVATRGPRELGPAMTATVCGLCMPTLLLRYGHLALMAQWEIIIAFVLYFQLQQPRPSKWKTVAAVSFCAVALWTHAYIFVMVISIIVAGILQATAARRISLWHGMTGLAVLLFIILTMVGASGYLVTGEPVEDAGFGVYSSNLMSAFVPQLSGLFPIISGKIIDATGGQYEGFCYLGGGTLLMIISTLPLLPSLLARSARKHAILISVLVMFTIFAASNQVFFGYWRLATIPLPPFLMHMASVFRSSGRFMWPQIYLLTAAVIVVVPAFYGRAAGGRLLFIAAFLQFADTSPLSKALSARVAEAGEPPLAEVLWTSAIRRHSFIRVLPPLFCLGPEIGFARFSALELDLLASHENVAINTVVAARHSENCNATEIAPLAAGELRVYMLVTPDVGPMSTPAKDCATSDRLAVCSLALNPGELRALSAQ